MYNMFFILLFATLRCAMSNTKTYLVHCSLFIAHCVKPKTVEIVLVKRASMIRRFVFSEGSQ